MNNKLFLMCLPLMMATLQACAEDGKNSSAAPKNLQVDSVFINGTHTPNYSVINNLQVAPLRVRIVFSKPIDLDSMDTNHIYFSGDLGKNYTYTGSGNVLQITTDSLPQSLSSYYFFISDGQYLGGEINETYQYGFITTYGNIPVFPSISDEELLTKVQQQTFKYFWDFGHPVSGLARERSSSGNVITSGGSGFGLMAIIVGIERGFVTRDEGLQRLSTIVDFLQHKADKFHGVFSHWLNGETGKAIAFSPDDNGGDLVETAYLVQGLLAVKEYFKNGTSTQEISLCNNIQSLWENVEWDWYRQNGQNVLYWHWSPDKEWKMNHRITGWNECLITYVLAASSPTHAITKEVYEQGWAKNGTIATNKTYYNNIRLPMEIESHGGPLFFEHYSFLGLNPHKLSDQYADYWEQATAHTRINYEYCKANPKGYVGYGANCWGLTASDIKGGYTASSPANDGGTIAPTAALSSFPYTPEKSMAALHFFYYTLGNKLWGTNGFKDAFNLSQNWFASDCLAIDQGPIVVMIENYRTGLIWNLLMGNADVQAGLAKLGYTVRE